MDHPSTRRRSARQGGVLIRALKNVGRERRRESNEQAPRRTKNPDRWPGTDCAQARDARDARHVLETRNAYRRAPPWNLASADAADRAGGRGVVRSAGALAGEQ